MYNDMPYVSFIILVYNQDKYIEEAIRSVLEQKCDYNIEIIIADDCSVDKSREICLLYRDKYPDKIKLIFNDVNKGVVQNFLGALNCVVGEYVSFLGGDDYYIDRFKTEKQLALFKNNDNLSAVYSNYKTLIQKSGAIYTNDMKYDLSGNCQDLFFELMPVLIQTAMIKKKVFDEEYFNFMNDERIKVDDYPTALWAAFNGEIAYIDNCTVVYRSHNESMTNLFQGEKAWDFMISHEYVRNKFISVRRYKPSGLKKIENEVCRRKLYHSFVFGIHRDVAKECYSKLKVQRFLTTNDKLRYLAIKIPSLKFFIKILIYIRYKLLGVPAKS